jgi:regulator of nucleoside diphosphate kinase
MEYLKMLEADLGRAEVVEPEAIPPDVVTLDSEVLLKDVDSGDTRIYKLVLPDQARAENSISILTPLGAAMLGCRVGHIIELPAPGGVWGLKVLDVLFQPEAVSVCCQ